MMKTTIKLLKWDNNLRVSTAELPKSDRMTMILKLVRNKTTLQDRLDMINRSHENGPSDVPFVFLSTVLSELKIPHKIPEECEDGIMLVE